MISEETFYGGAVGISALVDVQLHPSVARVWFLESSGLISARLPDARTVRQLGSPMMLVYNNTTDPLPILDAAGNSAVTPDLPVGQSCLISLLDNSTAAGRWGMQFKSTVIG